MKIQVLFLIIPLFTFSQIQIGEDIDGININDYLGESVSMSSDGRIVAVGVTSINRSGLVRVFENIQNSWSQVGNDIKGEDEIGSFGKSVSLSLDGRILAIGDPSNDGNNAGSGHVRIYENINNEWTQLGSDINGEAGLNLSGWSVSLSAAGDVVAIGAIDNNDVGRLGGHVRVFRYFNNEWGQIGQDIDGEAAYDGCGNSVSISSNGSIVAVGARYNDGNGRNSGHVRVFEIINNVWIQIGDDIDGEGELDNLGKSVSISSNGHIVAIGAHLNDSRAEDSGHVRVYENVNNVWTQVGDDIEGNLFEEYFGFSVSLSSMGNIVAVGASEYNVNVENTGLVRVFKNINNTWTQIGVDIDDEVSGDRFGHGVSLSSNGNTVVASAPYNNENGSNSGHARVYDLSLLLSSNNDYVLSQFSLFPNPVTSQFNIELKNDLILENITIYNNLGQKVFSQNTKTISIPDFSKGVYFVEILTNKGKATRKIVVK